MKPTHLTTLAVGAVLLVAGFYAGRMNLPASTETTTAADGRKVLYWHDPMVPGQRFDKPGKSPFMDMQLVPVYADGDANSGNAGGTEVKVSPDVQQNLGIRFATVRRADTSGAFDAIGSVQFDERLSTSVQSRVAGYVERLAVRAPMERVRRGQTLATIFAPDWLGPQNEFLALRRSGASAELMAAARERMRAMSIPAELLRQSEEAGVAQARFELSAPRSGVIAELGLREGMAVTPGMTLFRIAGLEKVWAIAEVPEAQALRLQRGQTVKARLQADGSQSFDGRLDEILPEVSAATRTLKARFEVDNRDGKLIPGMLLRLAMAGPSQSRLLVASEAVIRTGPRAIVMVRDAAGAFAQRELVLGAELGDDIEVLQGLKEGEQVVASGQFLLDSEARLKSVFPAPASPVPAPNASAPLTASSGTAQAARHLGQGRVESVTNESITISHAPIASMQWPAMTMGFGKAAPGEFAGVKPGDTVQFEFREGGPAGYELLSVQPVQPVQTTQPGSRP